MTITAYLNLRTGTALTSQGGYGLLGGREISAGMPPSEALQLPLGDTPTLRLRAFDPWDDDSVSLLAADTQLVATLKAWNDHNGDALARIANDGWDKPATITDNAQDDLADSPGGFYTGTLDLSGDDLVALMPAGTDRVYCHLQIETLTASGVRQSSQWIPVLILSDVCRGTDTAPVTSAQPTPSAPLYYKAITALTGGGTTALDGIPTVGKTSILVLLYVSDELQTWRLFSGTTAEDAASGIVRPDDYNASTNAQIWKRIG